VFFIRIYNKRKIEKTILDKIVTSEKLFGQINKN